MEKDKFLLRFERWLCSASKNTEEQNTIRLRGGDDGIRLSTAQKKILDTATMASEIAQANKATAVSSISGAKVLKKLGTLKEKLEKLSSNRSKTILGDIDLNADYVQPVKTVK